MGTPIMKASVVGAAAGSAAVAIGQMADTVTCAVMVRLHGIGAEANPLAGALLEHGGIEALIIAKAVLTAVCILAVLKAIRHREARLAAVVALAACGAGLFGAYTNIASW